MPFAKATPYWLVLVAAVLLLGGVLIAAHTPTAFAQADDTVTPTLAPSKTPTPAATSRAQTLSTTRLDEGFRSFTQADLSVLTGNVQRPNGLLWYEDMLYTACTGDWTLYEIDSVTGATRTYIWGIRNAHTLYAERDEANELILWVPDFQADALTRVTRSGVQEVVTELDGPWGIVYLDPASFLVSNLRSNSVMQVQRDGSMRELAAGLASPTGIARDDVYLYVANNGSTRRAIEWYDVRDLVGAASPADVSGQPLVTGLQNTTGVVLAGDGYLYFAYSLGTRGVVGRVDPEACRDGGCTPDQVEIVVLTELAAPLAGLTISPDMRLFVHTMFSPDVYWVQL